MPATTAPPLTYICRLNVSVGTPVALGPTALGQRRFIPVVGGDIAGPYLNGRILPGGGDWQTIRDDGVIELAAHYGLQLTDGTVVEFDNRGLRHGGAGGAAHYFQTTARLMAPRGAYEWLARTVFVAAAEKGDDGVRLDLFALDYSPVTAGGDRGTNESSEGRADTS